MNKDVKISVYLTFLFLLAGESKLHAYALAATFLIAAFVCYVFPDDE